MLRGWVRQNSVTVIWNKIDWSNTTPFTNTWIYKLCIPTLAESGETVKVTSLETTFTVIGKLVYVEVPYIITK